MNGINDSQPDGTVIADVLSGQTEQFAVLVRRYERALIRFAQSRLATDDGAEDVVQESFLCAFKSLHSYNSRFSFRTWLWTIVLNQCRRHATKRQRSIVRSWSDGIRVDTGQPAQDVPSESPQPLFELLLKERSEQMQRLLRTLPDAEADALRLRFYGDLKFQEVADAMNCSLSTAKNRVRWGLTKLSEQLVSGERP